MAADDLVELRKFSHLHEAEIAVSTLEAANIGGILREASFGGFRPEASIAGGGVTVLVRRDEVDAARDVLDAPMLHGAGEGDVVCASCGRAVNGTVCPWCDEEEEHELVLTPERTRSAIAKFKAAVILGAFAVMTAPVIVSRLSELDEGAVKTGLYAAAGVVIAIVLLRFFLASDERL
ncbi:MAG TPA: hypothetical protein VJ853_15125 [Thermoanaerobaculia bacterium]|nr:hypothetical protein [Thermoanaerobaculia bacterium]